jgi:hypothetical protein
VRRSISDPTEIAYYICYGPRRASRLDLAWIAGSRWRVEECFQQAKNEAGLDQYQVRSWRTWYAHITLSMLALAWLQAPRPLPQKGNLRARPGHDQLHATRDPPTARTPDPATRPPTHPRLVLVPLATTTPTLSPNHYRTRGYPR